MTPLQAPVPLVPVPETDSGLVRAMGLSFKNSIGIAAGIDRNGRILASLPGLTAGHIEIGTVTDPRDLQIPKIPRRNVAVLGVNIGSASVGFSEDVLADYRACLLSAWSCAAYIVLNFSNETAQRTLKSESGHRIVSMARNEICRRVAKNCARTPLLAKLPAGTPGEDLPVTQSVAEELDGFVLIGNRVERVAEFRAAFPDHGMVSVGGVRCAEDVLKRTRAGADLVQMHRVYADGGAAAVERILRDLEGGLEDD